MTNATTIRSRTLAKYEELNEQLRDFLKSLLLFDKSSSINQSINTNVSDNGGISLLAVKNDLLLHYIMNLVAVMSRRSMPNQTLNASSNRSLILRLCEIRTYMEKIRPIEQKLQYQMDKLLKDDVDQKLNYRANLDNFDTALHNDADTEQQEDPTESKIYRPPKLVPMEYHDDVEDKDTTRTGKKRLEHLQRRAYHSDLLDEFKMKYSDAPEEIYHSDRSRLLQNNRALKEKIAYEEDYLKRLPQTKRERIQLQRSMNSNGNDITDHLHDADILFDDKTNGFNDRTKKKNKISRKTKKRLEKNKNKTSKRFKSRK
jgi:U3 small nucleolar ribonucleoprotein protein LCP5